MNLEFLHEENQPTRCEFNRVRSCLSPETKQKNPPPSTLLRDPNFLVFSLLGYKLVTEIVIDEINKPEQHMLPFRKNFYTVFRVELANFSSRMTMITPILKSLPECEHWKVNIVGIGPELPSEGNEPREAPADDAETIEIISALRSLLLQISRSDAQTSQQILVKNQPQAGITSPPHTGRKGWNCFLKLRVTSSQNCIEVVVNLQLKCLQHSKHRQFGVWSSLVSARVAEKPRKGFLLCFSSFFFCLLFLPFPTLPHPLPWPKRLDKREQELPTCFPRKHSTRLATRSNLYADREISIFLINLRQRSYVLLNINLVLTAVFLTSMRNCPNIPSSSSFIFSSCK